MSSDHIDEQQQPINPTQSLSHQAQIPEIAKGYEHIYLQFLNTKLIYTHPKTRQTTEWIIGWFENPLNAEFDLSACDEETQNNVSINTGFKSGKNQNHKGKMEVYFMLRFVIDAQVKASKIKKPYENMMAQWDEYFPFGILWTYWDWEDTDCEYLITQDTSELGDNNLYEKYLQTPVGGCDWGVSNSIRHAYDLNLYFRLSFPSV